LPQHSENLVQLSLLFQQILTIIMYLPYTAFIAHITVVKLTRSFATTQ